MNDDTEYFDEDDQYEEMFDGSDYDDYGCGDSYCHICGDPPDWYYEALEEQERRDANGI